MANELKKAEDKLVYAFAYIKEYYDNNGDMTEEGWVLQQTVEEALFQVRQLRRINKRKNNHGR